MSEQYIACMNGPVGCPFAHLVKEKAPEKIDVWKEQLSREYKETKERYERLHAANVKRNANDNTMPYEKQNCAVKEASLMERQEKAMREYLDILEMRMAIAGISF